MSDTPEKEGGSPTLGSLDAIAAKAQEIYDQNFKEEFERLYPGQYVAVDVNSEKAYPHENSAGALDSARKDEPHGLFHLIRVGTKDAFKTTRSARQYGDNIWASP